MTDRAEFAATVATARRLALTGAYHNWQAIGAALVFDYGATDAERALADQQLRADLDCLCRWSAARASEASQADLPTVAPPSRVAH